MRDPTLPNPNTATNYAAESEAFFNFTPLPAGAPPDVYLPITGSTGGYQYTINVVGGQTYFVDPTVAKEIVRRVAEDELHMYRMEYELSRPVRRVVERVSAPVLGEQGQFLGQVVLFHDITALREKGTRASLRVVDGPERTERKT